MKELSTIAANFITQIPCEPGEKFTAQVEVILAISEAVYEIGESGKFAQERRVDTVRFIASGATLRKVAEKLNGYADEADANLGKALREKAEGGK